MSAKPTIVANRYTPLVSLFKSASIVSGLTLVSRITGLMRELLIASTFGASALTDAFNVAFRIPNLFRRLFAEGAFSQAFVPVLAASRQQKGDDATHVLINQVATLLIWALLFTSVLGVLGAPLLVWAMASGLNQSPQGFEVAVVMTRFMFPYIAFMSLVALAAGVLNTWKRFAVPAATPVLLNVSMIAAAWWGGPWLGTLGVPPIYALAVGVMLGGVAQLGMQLLALRRLGLMPRMGMSAEAIAALNPDVFLVMSKGLESVGGVDGLIQLPGIAQTQAGKNRAIVAVDDSLLLSFGPRSYSLLAALSQSVERVLTR